MKIFSNRKFLIPSIIIVNILFVGGLAFGEWQYICSSKNNAIENNKNSFVNANSSLSSMTNNYLLGGSHLCRSLAQYLNVNHMTMDDAKEFVPQSIINEDVVAHIINRETYKGMATKPHKDDENNYDVEYTPQLAEKVFTSHNEGEIFNDTNILVVEDNDINYEIISTLLGMHGILC